MSRETKRLLGLLVLFGMSAAISTAAPIFVDSLVYRKDFERLTSETKIIIGIVVFLSSALQFAITYWSLVQSQKDSQLAQKNTIAQFQQNQQDYIAGSIKKSLEGLVEDLQLPGHVRASIYTSSKRGAKLSIKPGYEHNMGNAKDRKLSYRREEVMVGLIWSRNIYTARVIDLSLQSTVDAPIAEKKLRLMKEAGVATVIYLGIESGITPNKTIAVLVVDSSSSPQEIGAAPVPVDLYLRAFVAGIRHFLDMGEL